MRHLRAMGRAAALLLLAGSLLAAAPAAQARPAAFDADPFHISGAQAEASGSVSWSHGSDPRAMRGELYGRLNYDGHSGCARLSVEWLNGDASTLRSTGRSACAGSSTDLSLSYSSPALQCVRLRLVVNGNEVGDSRMLCAGGS
jgi:hypothetical protein